MARSPRKTALTSSANPQLERQARRISRQQKQLSKELSKESGPVKLTGATSRSIKLADLRQIEPLTDTQADFFDAYEDGVEAFSLSGSAGTGKTLIALYQSMIDILAPETPYKKLIIIRSSVQSREQGHLPGDINEKMEAFEAPYHGLFDFLFNRKDAYEKLKDMGLVEFISSSFLRGSTYADCIVVVDEFSNMTYRELATIATRIGNNAKILFCGDYVQTDLVTKKTDVSGFREFMEVSKKMSEFRHFKFTTDDIVRSGFCRSWIIAAESVGL